MRYTVLTYIFAGYEKVHEIWVKDPEAEYLLITDDPNLKSETWTVIHDDSLDGLSVFNKCYEVRLHPFRYAHTDTVVRLDGSIQIRQSLKPLIDAFDAGGYDRCLMIHPDRNLMTKEYGVWVRARKYPEASAAKCLRWMERSGYDLDYKGIFQMCFEILRNDFNNNLLNDMTFDALRYLGTEGKIERIDQTVFSMLLNHYFADRMKILPVSQRIVTDGKMMQWHSHNSMVENRSAPTIAPVMFNKPCEVLK